MFEAAGDHLFVKYILTVAFPVPLFSINPVFGPYTWSFLLL